ncbi:MAG: hypothetical protein CMI53_01165 [Parcubacteria group bacterium]|nr:hypothetical protein [Parcubacteria group bacterium]
MPEINLLPDELRDKEQKELKSASKKPKVFSIPMSSPTKESVEQPLKTSRPSLLSRLFSKKTKGPKAKSKTEHAGTFKSGDIKSGKEVEKVAHIPKAPAGGLGKLSPDFLSPKQGSKKGANNTEIEADANSKAKDKEKEEVKFSPREEKVELEISKSNKSTKETKDDKKRGGFFSMFNKSKKDKKSSTKKNQKSQDESVIDVNLIPADLSRRQVLELPNKLFSSGLGIFISILVVVVGYLGIIWYQLRIEQQIEDQLLQVSGITEQIASYENNKIAALELQQNLKAIKQLLDKHVYWTQFFAMLEKYTISEVYYTNFSMAGTEGLVLSAVGRDYQSVAQQLVAFQQADDFIKTVSIDAASANAAVDDETATGPNAYSGVSFSINLEFIDGVFIKK